MSPPKVLGAELAPKNAADPRRDRTDPPKAELGVDFDPEERSTKSQVATFRTSRFQIGMPAAVLVALITAVSGFGIAWANKPAAVALTFEQERKLTLCAEKVDALNATVQKLDQKVSWIEPQIGILIVRTEGRYPVPSAPR